MIDSINHKKIANLIWLWNERITCTLYKLERILSFKSADTVLGNKSLASVIVGLKSIYFLFFKIVLFHIEYSDIIVPTAGYTPLFSSNTAGPKK